MTDWPNCQVADCGNKACLGLSDTLCYPHATGKRMDRDGNAIPPASPEEVAQWRKALGLDVMAKKKKVKRPRKPKLKRGVVAPSDGNYK